jgi:hypothetical protein
VGQGGQHQFHQAGWRKLVAEFTLSDAKLASIVAATEGEKHFPEFEVQVQDGQGELVAQVKRTLYVRSKPQHRGG